MGKGEPGETVCSASAQRRLSIPAMTPLGSRDQAKLQPKYARGDRRRTRVSQLEGKRDFVEEPPMHSKLLLFLHTLHMRSAGIDPIPH
jgi:hypothetical protein